MTDPTFTLAGTNSLGLSDVGAYAQPTLADIDGDGGLDVLIGPGDHHHRVRRPL